MGEVVLKILALCALVKISQGFGSDGSDISRATLLARKLLLRLWGFYKVCVWLCGAFRLRRHLDPGPT